MLAGQYSNLVTCFWKPVQSQQCLCYEKYGSHHRQVAMLVQDDKLDCFGILRKKFASDKNGPAFYPRAVLPLRTDGFPWAGNYIKMCSWHSICYWCSWTHFVGYEW